MVLSAAAAAAVVAQCAGVTHTVELMTANKLSAVQAKQLSVVHGMKRLNNFKCSHRHQAIVWLLVSNPAIMKAPISGSNCSLLSGLSAQCSSA